MTPEDQNKRREIKMGRGRREGGELTDLQVRLAGFTRAKGLFGCVCEHTITRITKLQEVNEFIPTCGRW